MSLSGYDLRKRGGPRQRWRLRPQLRPMTPRELRLAGWFVYGLVLAFVAFGCDRQAAVKAWSAWDTRPPIQAEKSTMLRATR